MVVGLRPRVAVARAREAVAVRLDQVRDQRGRVTDEPRVERGPDVEAGPRVVADEAAQPAMRIEQAGGRVRRVALAQDADVPVRVRRSGRFRAP